MVYARTARLCAPCGLIFPPDKPSFGLWRQLVGSQPAYTREGGGVQIPGSMWFLLSRRWNTEPATETGNGLRLLMTSRKRFSSPVPTRQFSSPGHRNAVLKFPSACPRSARGRLVRHNAQEASCWLPGRALRTCVPILGRAPFFPWHFWPSKPSQFRPSSRPVLGFAFALPYHRVVFGVARPGFNSHSRATANPARSHRQRTTLSAFPKISHCFQAALALVLLVGAGLLMSHCAISNAELWFFHGQPLCSPPGPRRCRVHRERLPALYEPDRTTFLGSSRGQSEGLALFSLSRR